MTQEQKHFIEKLYKENFEVLYHYAYTVLQDRPSAENLVNDTFLDAIKKIDLLFEHEKPVGWLINALKLHLRHYQYTRAKQPTVVSLESVREQADSAQNAKLTEAETVLSDEDRYFYELHYKVGYSHKELSKKFGISVSASQKRLERIRKKLKPILFEK